MPTCVPIKDMKNTTAFMSTVEKSEGPVTVTKNGYDAFVVMRSKDYDYMQQEIAQSHLLRLAAQSESEYSQGKCSDGEKTLSNMKEKYGL